MELKGNNREHRDIIVSGEGGRGGHGKTETLVGRNTQGRRTKMKLRGVTQVSLAGWKDIVELRRIREQGDGQVRESNRKEERQI